MADVIPIMVCKESVVGIHRYRGVFRATNKKPLCSITGAFYTDTLVGRRGFEPLISALRGRCPGPLDERPTHQTPD